MDFEEQAVDARGHAGGRERLDEFGLAGADPVAPAGQLQAVGDVVDDRIVQRPQLREGAHVDHEVVVSERRAPLGDEHLVVASRGRLGDGVPHVERREKLSFLQVHRAPRGGGGDDQVGLPAQERRDLEHVGHLGHRRGLRRLVDVGQDRAADPLPDRGEHLESARQPRTAVRRERRPVRLVERRLEHERRPDPCGGVADRRGQLLGVGGALDDAGTRDQRERASGPEAHATSGNRMHPADYKVAPEGRGRRARPAPGPRCGPVLRRATRRRDARRAGAAGSRRRTG